VAIARRQLHRPVGEGVVIGVDAAHVAAEIFADPVVDRLPGFVGRHHVPADLVVRLADDPADLADMPDLTDLHPDEQLHQLDVLVEPLGIEPEGADHGLEPLGVGRQLPPRRPEGKQVVHRPVDVGGSAERALDREGDPVHDPVDFLLDELAALVVFHPDHGAAGARLQPRTGRRSGAHRAGQVGQLLRLDHPEARHAASETGQDHVAQRFDGPGHGPDLVAEIARARWIGGQEHPVVGPEAGLGRKELQRPAAVRAGRLQVGCGRAAGIVQRPADAAADLPVGRHEEPEGLDADPLAVHVDVVLEPHRGARRSCGTRRRTTARHGARRPDQGQRQQHPDDHTHLPWELAVLMPVGIHDPTGAAVWQEAGQSRPRDCPAIRFPGQPSRK